MSRLLCRLPVNLQENKSKRITMARVWGIAKAVDPNALALSMTITIDPDDPDGIGSKIWTDCSLIMATPPERVSDVLVRDFLPRDVVQPVVLRVIAGKGEPPTTLERFIKFVVACGWRRRQRR
jgi:hypothetical protein